LIFLFYGYWSWLSKAFVCKETNEEIKEVVFALVSCLFGLLSRTLFYRGSNKMGWVMPASIQQQILPRHSHPPLQTRGAIQGILVDAWFVFIDFILA